MKHPSHTQAPPHRIIIDWLLVALMLIVIFLASAHTGTDLDEGTVILSEAKRWLFLQLSPLFGPEFDPSPIGHFCEYLVLGIFLSRALSHHLPTPQAMLVALLIASFYGATDEFHQLFVEGRSCDPWDWVVDTAGAALGILIVKLWARSH